MRENSQIRKKPSSRKRWVHKYANWNARRENSHEKKTEATFTLDATNVACGTQIQAQSQRTGVTARGVTSGVAILKSEASNVCCRRSKLVKKKFD